MSEKYQKDQLVICYQFFGFFGFFLVSTTQHLLGRASLGPKTQLVLNQLVLFFHLVPSMDQLCFRTKCVQDQLLFWTNCDSGPTWSTAQFVRKKDQLWFWTNCVLGPSEALPRAIWVDYWKTWLLTIKSTISQKLEKFLTIKSTISQKLEKFFALEILLKESWGPN